MATLSELRAKASSEGTLRGFRGTTNRNLGGTATPDSSKVTPRPGFVEKFVQKAGDVSEQTLNIAASVAKASGKYVVNSAKDIAGAAEGTFYALNPQIARERQRIVSTAQKSLDSKSEQITQAYRSGRLDKDNYTKSLQELSKGYDSLSKESTENARRADPKKLTGDMAESAINTLSLGGLTLIKTAAKPGVAKGLDKLFGKAAETIEKAVMKVPSVAPLVERNAVSIARRDAQRLAGETFGQQLKRDGKNIAIGLLIKRPVFYQTNIGGAQDIYSSIIEGKHGDAATTSAWMATQMLNGGPLGAAAKGFKWLSNKTGKLAYGTGSYIDELGKRSGTGMPNQFADYLQSLSKDSGDFKKAERVLRIAQETNLQMAGNNAKEAAERTLQHWTEAGIDLAEVTPKKAVDLLENWAISNNNLRVLGEQGKLGNYVKENLDRHVVGRWDVDAKNALANQFETAPQDIQAITDIYNRWHGAVGNAAANNQLLNRQIEKIINDSFKSGGNVGQKVAQGIRNISAVSVMPKGIPKKYKEEFAKLGFVIIQPFNAGTKKITPNIAVEDTRKLVTAAVKGDTDIFTAGTAPLPPVAAIARTLDGLGLSPQATTKLAQAQLSQQVAGNLAKTEAARAIGLTQGNLDEGGKAVLSKLQSYVDEKQPNKVLNYGLVAGNAPGPAITDIRQMLVPEIKEALGVSREVAKEVQKAIVKGYLDTPLEYRGLGDKIVDTLYGVNPLQKYYSRIQSAMRYTYNPFFRFQEKVETSLLAKAQARTILWNKSKQELDDGAKILDNSGLFSTGLSGEAAQDLTLGRITANLTQAQKRNIAGLAYKMAEAKGTTIDDMVRNYGDEVGDALRVIVQYPNKGVLNSALARTLNIAFFPMRYNAKVTKLAADIISREPPSVQLAMINSIFDFKGWLKSEEGIRWQRDNADAMQVFSWATPIGSINYWAKVFSGDARAGDFGSIGGLPLGILTQMLDSQGIINLNSPYVNPKTGDVLPKYIPESAKARASAATTDLLGSLFTYPGRILGLPGKAQSLNKLSQELTGAQGIDFNKVEQDDRLTDLQRNMIRVLKGDTSDEAIDALYRSPAPGQYNGYTLPPLTLPVGGTQASTQVARREGLPSKASQKKTKVKKIAQPIPAR